MRGVGLLFIAIITFVIVLLVKNPDIVKEFWLWVIGLAGIIVHIFQLLRDFVKQVFYKTRKR